MAIVLIKGSDLRVGDRVLKTISGESVEIEGFDTHPGFKGHSARVLCAHNGYRVTVFDDDSYRQLSNGVYCQTHVWFHMQQQIEKGVM